MRKISLVIISVIVATTLAGLSTSCNRNVFDQDIYIEIVDTLSPVDSVDPGHTWQLSSQKTLVVNINSSDDVKKLQILTDDPMASETALVVAEREVEKIDQFSMTISYPTQLKKLYAALVDSEGLYTVTSITPSSTNRLDFSSPLYQSQKIDYTPSPQYYAYCFEGEFPVPGDYDYNDMVMHIALERTGLKEMRFHVRLAAVGTSERQLAGAIRFPNEKKDKDSALISMEDIDTLFTVDDKSFNVNMHGEMITKQNMIVQKETDLLLKGRNGEPILNLFADAHWAMGDIRQNEYGIYSRKLYNVSQTSGTSSTGVVSQVTVPRTITYVLRVKNENILNYLTLDNIDPFIILQYNGAIEEVHTYPYRKVQALNKYPYVDVQNLPWALVIPSGTFNHPLEGVNMGFKMKSNSEMYPGYDILFGAYSTRGHAFGEWAESRNKSTDWYHYPEINQVFIW